MDIGGKFEGMMEPDSVGSPRQVGTAELAMVLAESTAVEAREEAGKRRRRRKGEGDTWQMGLEGGGRWS